MTVLTNKLTYIVIVTTQTIGDEVITDIHKSFNIETTNISTKDNIIVLNSEESGAGVTAGTAGIEIERGSATNVAVRWNGTSNAWQIQSGTDKASAGS